MINQILHMIWPSKCIQNAEWDLDILYCKKCKEAIAKRYIFDGEVRVYIFPKYRQYTKQIKERKDNQEINGIRYSLENVDFSEFDDLINSIRQSERELYTVSEDTGWVSEDSESEDSGELSSYYGSDGEYEYIEDNLENPIEDYINT